MEARQGPLDPAVMTFLQDVRRLVAPRLLQGSDYDRAMRADIQHRQFSGVDGPAFAVTWMALRGEREVAPPYVIRVPTIIISNDIQLQKDPMGLAGTLVHELGHAAAGINHGHDSYWREVTNQMGLTVYSTADPIENYHQGWMWNPVVWQGIHDLPSFTPLVRSQMEPT